MNKTDLTGETKNFFRYAQIALDSVTFSKMIFRRSKQVWVDKGTVYMLSFNLNAQLTELITVLRLFYETIEYVNNALCTVLVAPSAVADQPIGTIGTCLGPTKARGPRK